MKAFAPMTGVNTLTLTADVSGEVGQLAGTPRSGTFQVRVKNKGTEAASIKFGGSTVAAALTDMEILPGTVEILSVPSTGRDPITHVSAITTANTTDLDFTTGQGGV